MSRRQVLLSCALLVPSTGLASDGAAGAPLAPAPNVEEHGVPALFAWGDVDGDGRLDLAAVSGDGELQLLASTGDGRFVDVTEEVGLAGIAGASFASWADYDGDGRLDLFVGAREGASRLFRNEGGAFLDVSAGSGLASAGPAEAAQWLDHDGDGRLDLFVAGAEKSVLYRGAEGGFFALEELPVAGAASGPARRLLAAARGESARVTPTPGAPDESEDRRPVRSVAAPASRAGASAGLAVRPGSTPSAALPFTTTPVCVPLLEDQANPSTCLKASTIPTLGRLYPISANLFVAVGGNVGVGTTSPTARLEVAGTARVSDTLTLAPSGDMALDVSTGSIYKAGALFIHTKGSLGTTAVGQEALNSVTGGAPAVTAVGFRALFANTYGGSNTATGFKALYSVKYHLLSAMLLNELKKEVQENDAQRSELSRLEARLAAVEAWSISVAAPPASSR